MPHPLPEALVELIAQRFRVIAEPMRIRLLDALRDGPMTMNELSEKLGASQQNVSKHIGVLAQAGIVARTKDGNRVRCSIVDESIFELCELVCGGLRRQIADLDELLRGDVMSASPVFGPIGRLGRWTSTHFRLVAITWAVIAVGLGFFAPKVEHALSGAGWEATGSESLRVRETVDREFGGLSSSALLVVVHSEDKTAADPEFRATVADAERILSEDERVAQVIPPQPGQSISRDGHTAVVQAGAAADSNEMVRAASDLKEPLAGPPRRRRAGIAYGRVRNVVRLQRGEQDGDAQV